MSSAPNSPAALVEEDFEDRLSPTPPIANPTLDMDDSDNAADAADAELADDNDDLASNSDLSEVDEAEFADFDPNAVAIIERPTTIVDEDVARTLKASKKKRDPSEPKKPKEGRREKKKKSTRPRADGGFREGGDSGDDGADGEILREKRKPKSARAAGVEVDKDKIRERKVQDEKNRAAEEENLTPQERRRIALDRAMDAALKNPNKRRRKKDEVDLEEAMDEEIAALKMRMENACRDDNEARENGRPAVHKLKMLPEVVSLLNRNTVQHSIVDPDTNFLLAVKYFLEPLNDGSLPAYNIQRDLFNALAKLPIEKEALRSSGIGKVVLYYTKSKRPEIGVKRIAERLLGDWSRPILKRSDDYKKRKVESREFDAIATQLALRNASGQAVGNFSQSHSQSTSQILKVARQAERERLLAKPRLSNRATLDASAASYSIAPQSQLDPDRVDPTSRPMGASGDAAFRRMTQKVRRR